MANAAPGTQSGSKSPFSLDQVRDFVSRNAQTFREKGPERFAAELESLDLKTLYSNLEQLEQRLTAIEEKVIALLRDSASQESLLDAQRALDRDLKPYRGKMTADQVAMLEKQFLERRLLEFRRAAAAELVLLVVVHANKFKGGPALVYPGNHGASATESALEKSFVAQRDHGIDSRRSPRGDVAGRQGNYAEGRRDGCVG